MIFFLASKTQFSVIYTQVNKNMLNESSRKYNELRSQLVRQGTTLRRWAKENGFPVSSVYDAVRETRKGPNSRRIKSKLESDLA